MSDAERAIRDAVPRLQRLAGELHGLRVDLAGNRNEGHALECARWAERIVADLLSALDGSEGASGPTTAQEGQEGRSGQISGVSGEPEGKP